MFSRTVCFFAMIWAVGCTEIAPTAKQSAPTTSVQEMRVFTGPTRRQPVNRSNQDIADEILDLAFLLESGTALDQFTRFDGPVSVSFTKGAPSFVRRDLDRLLKRLRTEADIPIEVIEDGTSANILIDLVDGPTMRAKVPNAACFIVPNTTGFDDLRKRRNDPTLAWENITERRQIAVVIPNDIAPQETRDCLHEEIAQALGPLNDLYRLADSVYNDDNFHLILTSFDMLVLRTLYAPGLRNGMSRDEVAARLPGILARLNPRGQDYAAKARRRTTQAWVNDIRGAVGPVGGQQKRIRSINSALQASADLGYRANRLGYVLYARGRLLSTSNRDEAIKSYANAYRLFREKYGDEDIHTARTTVQIASLSLAAGDVQVAKSLLKPAIVSAKQAEDAALLVKLLALQAEILEIEGKLEQAAALRKETYAWGLYGLGSSKEVKQILDLAGQLGEAAKNKPNAEG